MKEKLIQAEYPVLGMSCAGCASSIQTVLNQTQGVREAEVNFASNSLWVEYDAELISEIHIQTRIKEAGFDLVVSPPEENELANRLELRKLVLKKKVVISLLFSIPVFIISMFFPSVPHADVILLFLTLPVILYAGNEFFINAGKQLKHFRANMDSLVALGTGAAFLYSLFVVVNEYLYFQNTHTSHVYFESAAVVISFILMGRYFEEKAKEATSQAVQKLMELQPQTARVYRAGEWKDVALSRVKKNEKLLIRPGEKIPADGTVIEGESWVEESMMSGEPIPVLKSKGDTVFAGTLNQKGSFQITVANVGDGTLLHRIIEQVKKAQNSKPPVQKLADKISAVFVPIVLMIATMTGLVWYVWGPEPQLSTALMRAVTVLVIACPCALGLATPAAITVAIGLGARQGILIKDVASLQVLHSTTHLILDKTGTITEGKPTVNQVFWAEKYETNEHKLILVALEKHSEHPLAQAVIQFLGTDSGKIEISGFQSVTGKGVIGEVNKEVYLAGNKDFIVENDKFIPNDLQNRYDSTKNKGFSEIWFANSRQVMAIFLISDPVKEGSKNAIQEIMNMGVDVSIVTGDNESTAKFVANEVGVSKVLHSALPTNKIKYLRSLREQKQIVAMVGDGINDAPSLALADASIAMGTGTAIAMDSAEIVIMDGSLKKIPYIIRLSRKTVKTIRQNLFWAFIYNIACIPLAAGAFYPIFGLTINPMMAGAAMALSSVTVLGNSLLLKKSFKNKDGIKI